MALLVHAMSLGAVAAQSSSVDDAHSERIVTQRMIRFDDLARAASSHSWAKLDPAIYASSNVRHSHGHLYLGRFGSDRAWEGNAGPAILKVGD